MAFGKDQKTLGAVGSFRQMSAAATKQTGGKRKGGGIPYFIDMYRPSTAEIDTIRLLPGEYLQDQLVGEGDDAQVVQVVSTFVKFVEHFDGHMEKGVICSAGAFANFKEKCPPCHGCDVFWETVSRNSEGRLESSRISRQGKYAFSVFDYGVYHKLEQYDKTTGQLKVNSVTKEPYYNWVKCLGQGCDACRAQKESKVGNASHWPMNYTQLQVLRDAEVHIGKSCVTCQQTDCIVSLGWMCRHCGECAIDMGTTELKNDELLKMTDYPYQCASCHQVGLLTEVYECRSCAPRGQTGVRATLFDVDLRVKLIDAATKGKSLQVMGWSVPYTPDPKYADIMKPVDLVARYGPTPLDIQAARLGIQTVPGPRRAPVTGPGPQQPMQPGPQPMQPGPQPMMQGPTPGPMPGPQPMGGVIQPPGQQPFARPYQNPYGPK